MGSIGLISWCRRGARVTRARLSSRELGYRTGWGALVVVVGVFGMVDVAAAKPRAPAALTAVPGQAAAGSQFSLIGSGMPAQRPGTVVLGSVRVARFRVNGHGDWAVRVHIPSRMRTAHHLQVVVGARRIVARFTVTRSRIKRASMTSIAALSSGEWVRLAPTRVRAGARVEIQATGFPAGAMVRVWLAGGQLARRRADRHGALKSSVRIPARTPVASYILSVGVKAARLRLGLVITTNSATGGSGSPGTGPPAHQPPPPGPGAPAPRPQPPTAPPPPPAPTIAGLAPQSIAQQAPISPVVPSTTGEVSRFSASGLPPGLSIDADSGVISGVPSLTGTFATTVTVIGPGGEASTGLRWTVGDPVIDAVGDMACAFHDRNYNGGNGNPAIAAPGNDCLQKFVSNLVINPLPSGLLDLGDNQYDTGALSDYQSVFGTTFGRANGVTYPSLGNAEYNNGLTRASGFFSYFGMAGVLARIKASGGNTSHLTTDGYYSFNLGTWHIIALNSNCTGTYSVSGGCAAGSPQELWLKQDLTAHHPKCIMAFWHHPRWNSGSTGNDPRTAAFWTDLYDAHATLVLNGHANHHYERFAPQNPSGQPAASGIREFIVSTGGQSHGTPPTTPGDRLTSQAINYNTFGALRLTLHPGSYDWHFMPAADGQPSHYTDTGSASCS